MPADTPNPEHSTRTEGPTPNGGAYAVAHWIGPDGSRATRETATAVEIIEFDADGNAIHRTYASLTPKPSDRIFPEDAGG